MAVFAVLALLSGTATDSMAQNGSIGVFTDLEASGVCGRIQCECLGRVYVIGVLYGSSAGGITGVEYKVNIGNSLPDPGWLFVETFAPNTVVLGSGAFNPVDGNFATRGVNVAWSSCQQGDPGFGVSFVLIETVEIYNFACNEIELLLQPVKHDLQSNPNFACPLFVLCDAPVYTKVCARGDGAYINPLHQGCNGADISECKFAVEAESWSRVKALYRN
jgi:hypothetical protein